MTFDFCKFSENEMLSLAAIVTARLAEGCKPEEVAFMGSFFAVVSLNLTAVSNTGSFEANWQQRLNVLPQCETKMPPQSPQPPPAFEL